MATTAETEAKSVTDSPISKSTNFWNSVSTIYESSSLTKHESDAELEFLNSLFITHGVPQTLACLGVADGCRDPYQLLEFMKNTLKECPTKLILNDLSPSLLSVCEKRLSQTEYSKIDTQYVPGPMDQLPDSVSFPKTPTNPTFVIGVYSSDYIDQSLGLYRENQATIGDQFRLSSLFFKDGALAQKDDAITFDINDYEKHMDQINGMRKNEDFVAYSIQTNTGFITHYFSPDGLRQIVDSVFSDKAVFINPAGHRYIIALILSKEGPIDCLITTLNNVLGNIPFDLQQKSLQSVNQVFF